MNWPSPQEFNEAVQNPHSNFADAELKAGAVSVNSLGLPLVATGAFASVYKLACPQREMAVRCFLRQVPNVEQRYRRISEFVMNDNLEATVSFDFVAQGIKVRGHWYPILKMDWVSGKTLDLWLRQNLTNTPAMIRLVEQIAKLGLELKRAGIAHGDLQHGNILVTQSGDLRLVDYDGMFVPALQGEKSLELGHRNYQHPARDENHFDSSLDAFSLWCILLSLACLIRDCTLAQQLQGLDECILFRQADFRYPLRSKAFALLENHGDPYVVNCARTLRSFLSLPPDMVPALDAHVGVPSNLPALNFSKEDLPASSISARTITTVTAPEIGSAHEWPTLTDYMKALVRPDKAFSDAELRNSTLMLDHGSITSTASEHAVVFRIRGAVEPLAVKFYLGFDANLEERLEKLRDYLQANNEVRAHFPDFKFLAHGVKVANKFYPATKMSWISAPSIFDLCERRRTDKAFLIELAHQFRDLMVQLRRHGIVHGNLNPNNILYTGERLILLDFDMTTIASTRNLTAPWKSNKHFRHPQVTASTAQTNDNFASWLMVTSLLAIAHEPSLWNRLNAAPGRLLFERSDLKANSSSLAFELLRNHYSPIVRQFAERVYLYCNASPDKTPSLPDSRLEDKELFLPEQENPATSAKQTTLQALLSLFKD